MTVLPAMIFSHLMVGCALSVRLGDTTTLAHRHASLATTLVWLAHQEERMAALLARHPSPFIHPLAPAECVVRQECKRRTTKTLVARVILRLVSILQWLAFPPHLSSLSHLHTEVFILNPYMLCLCSACSTFKFIYSKSVFCSVVSCLFWAALHQVKHPFLIHHFLGIVISRYCFTNEWGL